MLELAQNTQLSKSLAGISGLPFKSGTNTLWAHAGDMAFDSNMLGAFGRSVALQTYMMKT